jgi:3-mercaptopyruvate sulfurtransferase SseA
MGFDVRVLAGGYDAWKAAYDVEPKPAAAPARSPAS